MNRIILIFSTLILLFACNTNNEEQKNITTTGESNEVILTDAQVKNAGIVTATLQNNEIVSLLKVNGKIDVPPQNLVSISVPMGGYLKHTKLLPGMHVTKGDVIATIKDQQYIQLQQDYLTTKSKLHFAELEYNRQQELNLSQASSDKITQQAEAELRANQILLASLKEKLQLANINSNNVSASNITESIPIFSPINGFVTKVNANIGKYINPSEVMFELVDPTDIHLNVKVYEKDVNSLAIGKKVIAYTNANPNQKYDGKIILINKNISTDGTADVHCHFKTYDKILLPGMYMNAEIATSRSNANTLPENIDIRKDQAIVTQGAYALLMKMKNTEE